MNRERRPPGRPYTPLDTPVQFLKGVGPRRSEALGRMGIVTARDLLYHLPRRYEDASTVTPVARLEVGMDATAVGSVRSKGVIPTRSGLRIFQAVLQDATGMITCAWPGQPWLDRRLREGDRILVSGPVKFFHGRQMQPREFTVLERASSEGGSDAGGGTDGRAGADGAEAPDPASVDGTIFVAYPASEEIPQWVLRRIFQRNLDRLLPAVESEEWLPPSERSALRLPALAESLEALHRPSSLRTAEAGRRRLAFDELFFLQLVQARARHRQTVERPGVAHRRSNRWVRPLHDALPFQLTDAQARVLREIADDMTSARRMSRLLQGDVGAGKTLVALFAMLLAAEGGWQSVLMAPTELLAEQHHRTIRGLLEEAGVEIEAALLTGSLGAGARRGVLEGLDAGRTLLAVGTHALIQEGVDFARLGLVVVDEQHRFGVRQRMALAEREPAPDVLVMSATPIPRSLAMALYGDLDLSVLDELPPGRKPVRTHLRPPGRRDEVYGFLEQEMAAGRQAYVVYPLVEESEKVDLRAATEEHRRLAEEVFPDRNVGLIHGQLAPEEKDRVMRAFRDGEVDLLVSTSVIEVGIDVPNATVMVVEHAERFGLSQLHQLRGRVGRGSEESHCILLAQPGELSAERLRVFRDTADGFEVARADLHIRGQGDLFGAQQHGRDPLLRYADLQTDEDLLVEARRRARARIEDDPELEADANARVRSLLEERYGERLRMFEVG